MSSPPEQDPGQELLRQLFGALPVDIRAAALDPLKPLPGAPFLLPRSIALLAGPEGSGKSQVAQTIAYDVALAGGKALYLSGELTHAEFNSRARHISETRDGEITDDAAQAWLERVAFADAGEALPAIWGLQAAWKAVCADYALVVLDAVSDAGGALNLKFASDNDDWLSFWRGFARPCQGRVALLLLDNIGHAEDARTRALGASAKGHKVDVRLSSKKRDEPLSLVITAEKVRAVRAPFRKGSRWVAYEAGCRAPCVFDARQIEAEQAAAPDPVAVVVAALEEDAPQGQHKLVKAMREAGIEGRTETLRERLKAMVDDPDCRVHAADGRGYQLASEENVPRGEAPFIKSLQVPGPQLGPEGYTQAELGEELPAVEPNGSKPNVPRPMPQGGARAPSTDWGPGPGAGTASGPGSQNGHEESSNGNGHLSLDADVWEELERFRQENER